MYFPKRETITSVKRSDLSKKKAVKFHTQPGKCANSKKQFLNKKKLIKPLQKALVNTTIDWKSLRRQKMVIAYEFNNYDILHT